MNDKTPPPRPDPWASPPRSGGFELQAFPPRDGDESFRGTAFKLSDFWQWAFGDLAVNITRSHLAEFLVARALGDDRPRREEWANFDVLTPDGIRVEVKSAAYLQRWRQWKPSQIRFGGFSGRSWDPQTGYFSEERSIRADVFVFAVQTCLDPVAYDPFDVGQWAFYVVAAETVAGYGYRSANLAWVQRAAGASVGYLDLPTAVTGVMVGRGER